MDSSFARAVVSFALVASAYWAYLNIAEPLMAQPATSPNAPEQTSLTSQSAKLPATSPVEKQPVRDPTARFMPMIAPHFPEGSWERTSARIIKNDQFMLLFRELDRTEDGRLRVHPCTIVFQPQGIEPSAQVKADDRTWTVQAPKGATLSFDQPIDQRMMKFGRLVSAFVQDQVTIRGSESRPGAGDQVELTTENVQLSEQRIWTPGEVHFRVGPHFGSGRDLSIAMSPVTQGAIKRLPTTVPARVQSIELVHLDRLQVSMPTQKTIRQSNGELVQRTEFTPISIGCDGFLLMEMARGVAQITKNVRISRPRLDATGLEDHLHCDHLTLYFSRNLIFDDDRGAQPPPFDFERLVATGQPAAYSSPRGRGVTEAKYRLQSPKFEFGLGGRPEFVAEGAGLLSGVFGDDQQQAEVSWQAALTYRDELSGPLLMVEQQAECRLESLGQMSAERIQVRLNKTASGSRLAGLQPTSVTAEGRVRADVRQVKAQVNSLAVSFREAQQGRPLSDNAALQLNAPQTSNGQVPDRNFIVTGDALELVVARAGDEVAIDEITIDRDVRCVEVLANNVGRGAELTGDRFELKQMAAGAAVGMFSGSPVAVRANQLDVRGSVVRFEQASNRLWIDGAGSAALPLPPEWSQQFAGRAKVAYLNWQRSLSFNGEEVRADGGVELRGPAQLIRCATLLARLSRPIRLADRSTAARLNREGIELNDITADGGVFIENRTFDQRGLIAVDTGTMQRVNIDQTTSELIGVGPGQIKTVRFQQNPLGGQQVLGKPGPASTLAKSDELGSLRVQFQRRVAGNLRTKRLSFDDRVQAIYGPVTNWDVELPNDPRALTDGQVALQCDRLSVAQVLRRGQTEGTFEFESQGNTVVQNREFRARADRLTYDQSKDLIVLRGGVRDDAEIVRRSGGKQQSTSARVIKYRPKANRVDVEGANEILLN